MNNELKQASPAPRPIHPRTRQEGKATRISLDDGLLAERQECTAGLATPAGTKLAFDRTHVRKLPDVLPAAADDLHVESEHAFTTKGTATCDLCPSLYAPDKRQASRQRVPLLSCMTSPCLSPTIVLPKTRHNRIQEAYSNYTRHHRILALEAPSEASAPGTDQLRQETDQEQH